MRRTSNIYTKDTEGQETIIDSDGFQVMMEWEKPYMEALVDNMNPSGDVLEIGFGFGYSASRFMMHPINSYTVVECDEVGIQKAEEWASKQTIPVRILKGFWQIELFKLKDQFDCVFFDDSPLQDKQESDRTQFFSLMLTRLAKRGCKLSFYTQEPPWFHTHPATTYSCKTMHMDIPEHCLYFNDNMKKNKTMFLPLIGYPYGSLSIEELQVYAL